MRPTLRRARDIGLDEGLHDVYGGNVAGDGGENTCSHHGGALLIERYGFALRRNRIRDAACPDCGTLISGVGMSGG